MHYAATHDQNEIDCTLIKRVLFNKRTRPSTSARQQQLNAT